MRRQEEEEEEEEEEEDEGHLSTPVQGKGGWRCESVWMGVQGGEIETYFSTLCKSCWCQSTK